MNNQNPMRIEYDLENIAAQIFNIFDEANELYFFGSRRHRTRSERSDIDLILRHQGHIKPSDVRQFIDDYPALDIFLTDSARAISVVNESYVESTDFDGLIQVLSALKVWSKASGKEDVDVDWKMVVRADVVFTKTVLPGILVLAGGQFIDPQLGKNTRNYIERIVEQINECHARGLLDGCAVLCRRLAEILIIEVYESKASSATIKHNGNYMMLEGLINVIAGETAFDAGRTVKTGLQKIKEIGDRSAHGRGYIAKYSDLEQIRQPMRDVVGGLIQISQLQRQPVP